GDASGMVNASRNAGGRQLNAETVCKRIPCRLAGGYLRMVLVAVPGARTEPYHWNAPFRIQHNRLLSSMKKDLKFHRMKTGHCHELISKPVGVLCPRPA